MPGPDGLQIDTAELSEKLKQFAQKSHDEARTLSLQVSHGILSQARRRAPIASGFLKNDSPVDPQEIAGSKGLGYEFGFNAEYAAAVHERSELTHSQGQAFYLRDAIVEDGPKIMERAVATMAQRLAGRSGG